MTSSLGWIRFVGAAGLLVTAIACGTSEPDPPPTPPARQLEPSPLAAPRHTMNDRIYRTEMAAIQRAHSPALERARRDEIDAFLGKNPMVGEWLDDALVQVTAERIPIEEAFARRTVLAADRPPVDVRVGADHPIVVVVDHVTEPDKDWATGSDAVTSAVHAGGITTVWVSDGQYVVRATHLEREVARLDTQPYARQRGYLATRAGVEPLFVPEGPTAEVIAALEAHLGPFVTQAGPGPTGAPEEAMAWLSRVTAPAAESQVGACGDATMPVSDLVSAGWSDAVDIKGGCQDARGGRRCQLALEDAGGRAVTWNVRTRDGEPVADTVGCKR